MRIRVTLTGRSYHLADGLPAAIELSDGGTIDDVLSDLSQRLGDDAPLPATCLISVGGKHIGSVANHDNRALADNDEVLLIAPVAGG